MLSATCPRTCPQILRDAASKVRRRYLTSTVTVRVIPREEDRLPETLMHIQAAAPQLVVTDWPRGEEERAMLRTLVVEAPCTVVLWGGYSPNAPQDLGRSPSVAGGGKTTTGVGEAGGIFAAGAAGTLPAVPSSQSLHKLSEREEGSGAGTPTKGEGEQVKGGSKTQPGPPGFSSSARSIGGGGGGGTRRGDSAGEDFAAATQPADAADPVASAAALPPPSPQHSLAAGQQEELVLAASPPVSPSPPSPLLQQPAVSTPQPQLLAQRFADEGVGAETFGEQEGEEFPEHKFPGDENPDGGEAAVIAASGGGASDGGGEEGATAAGDAGDDAGAADEGEGLPPRRREWSITKVRHDERWTVRLRKLLTDDAYQDALAEALLDDLWACAAAAQRALRPRRCGGRGSGARQSGGGGGGGYGGWEGEEEEEDPLRERERDVIAKEAAESLAGAHGGRAPVASAAESKIVTAESMAMTAAQTLSPKFSKLIVCGWPYGQNESAELVRSDKRPSLLAFSVPAHILPLASVFAVAEECLPQQSSVVGF